MAIDSSLKHNSAGVYTLIIDNSQAANEMSVSPTRQRLLVGFSKQGPSNRPVLVNNYTAFTKMFGDIDRSLEKYGSYFQRMAKMCLNKSSITVLNLLNADDDDKVQNVNMSVKTTEKNSLVNTLTYSKCFDTSVFWIPDADTYGYGLESSFGPTFTKQILNFVNINKKPVSILVKKSSEYNRSGYNIAAKDWYGSDEIPSYINPTSIISDYFVDVYIVSGDFGPANTYSNETNTGKFDDEGNPIKTVIATPKEEDAYSRFTSDITYQKYFNEGGLIAEKLEDFLNETSVTVLASYTGCLLPNFTNKLGVNVWIQKLINDDTNTTGILCYENTELIEDVEESSEDIILENIDITGHYAYKTLFFAEAGEESSEIPVNMLSYNGEIKVSDYEQIEAVSLENISLNPNEVLVNTDTTLRIGDYIGSSKGRITRVYNISTVSYDETKYKKVTCYDAIDIVKASESDKEFILKAPSIDSVITNLSWTCLNGFKLTEKHLPGKGVGTDSMESNAVELQQEKILDILSKDNSDFNLYKSLTDKNIIDFRYLVDTFGNGIQENSKKVYTELCKKKIALPIINAPSIKEFKASQAACPVFRGKNGAVSAEYISKGGNPDITSNFRYSLPTEEQGAAFSAFYYPNVTVLDNGITKCVPPAAAVSNLFYDKAENPWYIIGGTELGALGDGITGVEGTITEDNRDWLQPFGFNSIIKVGDYNAVVYGNVTAKQTPLSSLSSVHCVDTLIYIAKSIDSILQRYVFGTYHNDDATRREIKALVDSFLEDVKSAGGIYDYVTIMNKTNNTNELIDANTGVIDVHLELSKGLEVINDRITIEKTGTISTLSFNE